MASRVRHGNIWFGPVPRPRSRFIGGGRTRSALRTLAAIKGKSKAVGFTVESSEKTGNSHVILPAAKDLPKSVLSILKADYPDVYDQLLPSSSEVEIVLLSATVSGQRFVDVVSGKALVVHLHSKSGNTVTNAPVTEEYIVKALRADHGAHILEPEFYGIRPARELGQEQEVRIQSD